MHNSKYCLDFEINNSLYYTKLDKPEFVFILIYDIRQTNQVMFMRINLFQEINAVIFVAIISILHATDHRILLLFA